MALKNNFSFYLTETLTVAGTTVKISNDTETNSVVELTTGTSFVLQNEDGSIKERCIGTATGGTLTLTTRGVKNDDTWTGDNALKKERARNTKVYLTILSHQIPEKNWNNTWSGVNTLTGTFDVTGEFYFPEYTTAWRDAVTWNRDGAFIKNTTTGTIQQRVGWAWVDVGSSTTPNASDTVSGKVELATQSETELGAITWGVWPLVVTPATINPNNITTATLTRLDKISFSDVSDSNKLKSSTIQTILDLNNIIKLAWEDITEGNALRYWRGILAGDTITQSSNDWNRQNVGYSATEYGSWQSFTLTNGWILSNIKIRLQKVWTPTWNLYISVYSNAWTPVLQFSSNAIIESTISWSPTEYTFTFNNFLPAWTYRFMLWADRAVNTSNYTRAVLHGTITSWTRYVVNSSNTWSATRGSNRFSISVTSLNEPSTKVYKSSAINSFLNVIWFANNTWVTDTNIEISLTYNNKLTWLTANTIYYLSDTPWAISTTPWTISKVVWRSISTTELLINLFA